jgi:predicted permease
MISFFLLCVPIFGTIVLGWTAAKAQLTSQTAIEVLGAFSFRFALPALVMGLIASEPLSHVFNPIFFAGYLASGSLVFVFTFGVAHLAQQQSRSVAGARATCWTERRQSYLLTGSYTTASSLSQLHFASNDVALLSP